MNLPLGERLVVDGLQDGLVPSGGELQQDHVLRVAVLEHSVPSDPSLTNLPDLLLGVPPGGEGGVGEGAVGGVQVELVQRERQAVVVEGLEAREAAQGTSGVVKPEVSGVENPPLDLQVGVESLEEEHERSWREVTGHSGDPQSVHVSTVVHMKLVGLVGSEAGDTPLRDQGEPLHHVRLGHLAKVSRHHCTDRVSPRSNTVAG